MPDPHKNRQVARYLPPDRIVGLSVVTAALTLTFLAWFWWTGAGPLSVNGLPFGTDFSAYWHAARLVVDGDPAAPYDAVRFKAEQAAVMGSHGFFPFHYPPAYLLLIAPFGLLPYLAALVLFLGLSFTAFLLVARQAAGHATGPLTRRLAIVLLGMPAFLLVVLHGQNAFLAAALFGAALLLADRRERWAPVASGALLAILTVKPHLGLLIPFALIAGGYWRVIVWATLFTLALGLLSLAAFGTDPWIAFFAANELTLRMLRDGLTDWGKLISLYGSLRILGAGHMAALAAQAVLALAVVAAVWAVWRDHRSERAPLRYAILMTGALIATPYALDYDLYLMTLPMIWLYRDGQKTGFDGAIMPVLILLWMLPAISRALAMGLAAPIAPLVLVLAFFVLVGRWRAHPGGTVAAA